MPQVSVRTVQYIMKNGTKAAMEKLMKTTYPKKLLEAEAFYYQSAYELIPSPDSWFCTLSQIPVS